MYIINIIYIIERIKKSVKPQVKVKLLETKQNQSIAAAKQYLPYHNFYLLEEVQISDTLDSLPEIPTMRQMRMSTILIALSTGKEGFVQVALANFLCHVIGIIFWIVIPVMMKFPLHGALIFGILLNNWQFSPMIYVAITFFAVSFLFIVIIKLTQISSTGIKATRYIVLSLLVILCICFQYWWINF